MALVALEPDAVVMAAGRAGGTKLDRVVGERDIGAIPGGDTGPPDVARPSTREIFDGGALDGDVRRVLDEDARGYGPPDCEVPHWAWPG